MDRNLKFYDLSINHKLISFISEFNYRNYYEEFLNLEENATPEFLAYYEKNNPIINSPYTGILKNFDINYENFCNFPNKIFSNKIANKLKELEKNESIEQGGNYIYDEVILMVDDTLKNLTNAKHQEALPKFYCKICDKYYTSEKNHHADIQKEYKAFLGNYYNDQNENLEMNIMTKKSSNIINEFSLFKEENNNENTKLNAKIVINKKFSFLKKFLPDTIYYFSPYETKLSPIYYTLKSELFKEYTLMLFSDRSICNLSIQIPESNLSFEMLNYYSIIDEKMSNLALKMIIDNINETLIFPDSFQEVIALTDILENQLGGADSYIGGILKSKKKEKESKFPENSIIPIFNFEKCTEEQKKLIKEIFPNNDYPIYKVKPIKISIPDKEISNCGICGVKFGLIFTRKHHCRVCGYIFCDDCLIWTRVPYLGYLSRVRSCKNCLFVIRKELSDVILENLINLLNNFPSNNSEKKFLKKKILYLIGLLKKLNHFSKWSFLGYELLNNFLCSSAIICFRYENIQIDEWCNVTVFFCKKGLYKKAFKCLAQVRYLQLADYTDEKKFRFLHEKFENYKQKSKEDFEIYGVSSFICFYVSLLISSKSEKEVLSGLIEKAYTLENEKYYDLSKFFIYVIRENFSSLSSIKKNDNKYEQLIFEYGKKILCNENNFFFIYLFKIVELSLDNWLNLLMEFIDYKKFNMEKADIIYKCLQFFYADSDFNNIDNINFRKIKFYFLSKSYQHIYNPDYWLEAFRLNCDMNANGDNMILLIFLRIFCRNFSIWEHTEIFFIEKKFEFYLICHTLGSILNPQENTFLNISQKFFENLLFNEALNCVFLSSKSFKEAGDYFYTRGSIRLAISCYYQIGYEKATELIISNLKNLNYEDFILSNFSILNEKTNEKISGILLINLLIALKDNRNLSKNELIFLLCKSIKTYENYIDNPNAMNFHLLLSDMFIEENFQYAIGALHSVNEKGLDEFFLIKFEETLEKLNKKYSEIIYWNLINGYNSKKPLIYFIDFLKQMNMTRIEQADKFIKEILNNKLKKAEIEKTSIVVINNDIDLSQISNNPDRYLHILIKLINSYREKYLNNYHKSVDELFDILLEYPNEEINILLTEVFKAENYYFTNSMNILTNNLRWVKENLKIYKNNPENSDEIFTSKIHCYGNIIDLSYPNASKENKIMTKKEENLYDNENYFEEKMNYFNYKQAAFDYLDITNYLDNDLDKAQSIIIAIVFLLKESTRTYRKNYLSALKKIIIELIFDVFYIVKNFSTGITQLYFYKILLVIIFEILNGLKLKNEKSFVKVIKQILIGVANGYKIFPFVNKNILSLENFSYLKGINSKFMNVFLKFYNTEFSISEIKFYSWEYSRLQMDNNLMFNLLEFKNFVFLKNKINLAETEKYLKYDILSRNETGFLNIGPGLALPKDSFSFLHGFRMDFANKKLEFLIEKTGLNLFSISDINEIYQKGMLEICFNLSSINTDFPIEIYYKAEFSSNLKDTNLLFTIFHVDYLLKMFAMGIEISTNFPYNSKCANETYISHLPVELAKKFSNIITSTQSKLLFEQKSPNLWIECSHIGYNLKLNPESDHLQFYLFDPIFNFHSDNPKLDELRIFLTENFTVISHHFPILKRMKEIVKIISSVHIVENLQAEQFLINTKTAQIDSELQSMWQKLPPLPSKWIVKDVTVMKNVQVYEYDHNLNKSVNKMKLIPKIEKQTVLDETNFNKQIASNSDIVKGNVSTKFGILVENKTALSKFCESHTNRDELYNVINLLIKEKKIKDIKAFLENVKKKIGKNERKFSGFKSGFLVPTGIFNRKNNSVIYGGVHLTPKLVYEAGFNKSYQELNNSKFYII